MQTYMFTFKRERISRFYHLFLINNSLTINFKKNTTSGKELKKCKYVYTCLTIYACIPRLTIARVTVDLINTTPMETWRTCTFVYICMKERNIIPLNKQKLKISVFMIVQKSCVWIFHTYCFDNGHHYIQEDKCMCTHLRQSCT